MDVISIELTQQQLNNLQVFMQRVDLKGNEVPAYVEIFNVLNEANVKAGDTNVL